MSNRTVIKKALNEVNRPPSTNKDTMKMLSDLIQGEGAANTQQRPAQGSIKSQSSYKGALASEKHFTPQELNKLHLKTNGTARPDSNKKIVREELKKTGSKMSFTGGSSGYGQTTNYPAINQSEQDFMNSSKGMMSQEQQERLKTLSKRPFSVKSSSSSRSDRPGTANSEQALPYKEEKENDFTLEDDVYEEISVTEVEYEDRQKLMRQLDQREKDRESLELESVFADLRKSAQVKDEDEFEKISNISLQEIKEYKEDNKKQVNIYKPTLKKNGQPQQQMQQQPVVLATSHPFQQKPKSSQPSMSVKQLSAVVPIPTGNDGYSRLDQIYQQIKDLQKFKDEIVDDLDEFMDDFETKSMVTIPEQFDEVVDIIAQEQRERGEQMVEYQEKGMNDEEASEAASEVLDENGNPFWMRFFKEDYLGEQQPKGATGPQSEEEKKIASKLQATLDKQEKMRREMEKIRKLDAELAQKTRFQRDLKNARMAKQQMADEEVKRGLEVAIQSQKSLMEKEEKKRKGAKPPNAASNKKRQQQQDDDGGDTFLTDFNRKQRANSSQSAKQSKAPVQEEEDDIDSDEYQDVVYDYEQTQALVDQADDFLHQPMLSLPAPGDDKNSSHQKGKHNLSQISFHTNATGVSTGSKNFMQLNRDKAKDYNPYKKPMICDTLDAQSRSRLDVLTKDIDEDLDTFIKQKDEFYEAEMQRSQYGGAIAYDANNAYNYSKEDVDRIERINQSLRKVAPMLPPSEEEESFISQPASAAKSKGGASNYDHSKFLASDDKQSMRSMPMSTATRRSNLTMLTHQTFKSGMQQLPRDRKLREQAQNRILKTQLREIDSNLRKINESDDLSYAPVAAIEGQKEMSDSQGFKVALQKRLIDQDTLSRLIEEAREDEERFSIMQEMRDEFSPADTADEQRVMLHSAAQQERTIRELAKIDEQSKRYLEAEQEIGDIEVTKERYLHVLDTVNEREKSLLQLEVQVKKLYKESEKKMEKFKQSAVLKGKVDQIDEEVKQILSSLDDKEQRLAVYREKEEELVSRYEGEIALAEGGRLSRIQEVDEGDGLLERVMEDMAQYNRMQEDLDREERNLTDHNSQVLAMVQRGQEGRDDNGENELQAFAREELEIYRQELIQQRKEQDEPQEK